MLFWIVAAAMTAAVTALVLTPLLRARHAVGSRASYDMEVYRDQLAELERDLARGVIDDRQAQAARTEIGRRMLAVADERKREAVSASAGTAGTGPSRSSRAIALALCVVIPAGALAVYIPMGSPNLPGQPFASRETNQDGPPAQVMQAIAKLEQHLKEEPGDLQGWMLMAQTYTRMGRFDDSVEAYRNAVGVSQGRDPGILSSYAEAMIAANQGMVPEEATRTFEAVLQSDPKDPRARYYLALARGQAGDMRGALDRWVELAAQSPADAPWLPTVRQRITDTAGQLGLDIASVMPQPLPPSPMNEAASGGAPAPGPTREQMAGAADMTPEQRDQMIRGMVDNLATRLRDNPNDAEGWLRLGRAYKVLGEQDKSIEALESGAKAAPGRVDVLMAYADALMSASGDEDAPPASAIAALRNVLALQPDNPQALWFLGLDAARAANTSEASQLWGRLLTQLKPGTPEYAEVQSRLDSLRQGG